jgi:hypothetical protein
MDRHAFLESLPFLYPCKPYTEWPGNGELLFADVSLSIEPSLGEPAFFILIPPTAASSHDGGQASVELALEKVYASQEDLLNQQSASDDTPATRNLSSTIVDKGDADNSQLIILKLNVDGAVYQISPHNLDSMQVEPATDNQPACWIWTWPSISFRFYTLPTDNSSRQQIDFDAWQSMHQRVDSILPHVRVKYSSSSEVDDVCSTMDATATKVDESYQSPGEPAQKQALESLLPPSRKRLRSDSHSPNASQSTHDTRWQAWQACHEHIHALPMLLSRPISAGDKSHATESGMDSLSRHLTEAARLLTASYKASREPSSIPDSTDMNIPENPIELTVCTIGSRMASLEESMDACLDAYFPVRPKGSGRGGSQPAHSSTTSAMQEESHASLEEYLAEHYNVLQQKYQEYLLPERDGSSLVISGKM